MNECPNLGHKYCKDTWVCPDCGMSGEKYEVIVPERIYIVNSLKDAWMIKEKYKLQNITIRLIK